MEARYDHRVSSYAMVSSRRWTKYERTPPRRNVGTSVPSGVLNPVELLTYKEIACKSPSGADCKNDAESRRSCAAAPGICVLRARDSAMRVVATRRQPSRASALRTYGARSKPSARFAWTSAFSGCDRWNFEIRPRRRETRLRATRRRSLSTHRSPTYPVSTTQCSKANTSKQGGKRWSATAVPLGHGRVRAPVFLTAVPYSSFAHWHSLPTNGEHEKSVTSEHFTGNPARRTDGGQSEQCE